MTALRSEWRSYKAVGSFFGVERLAFVAPDNAMDQFWSRPGMEEPNWDVIHGTIQDLLKSSVSFIRTRLPEIRVCSGRTAGSGFPLYSYIGFDLGPVEEIDAVVMGIEVRPAPSGAYLLKASLGGEESGRIDYEAPSVTVNRTTEEILVEASRLARELVDQRELIVERIQGRPPLPSY